MKITLKDTIKRCKEYDNKYNVNTVISVHLTANGRDNKRHMVVVNPDTKNFTDKMVLTCFYDSIVTDINRFIISDKYHLLTIIVDVEEEFKELMDNEN